jgi:hypothetical protein
VVAAERFVTTVIGSPAYGEHKVIYAASGIPGARLMSPLSVCLIPSPSGPAAATVDRSGDERDAVRLFVGCMDGVHAFDLARGGQRKQLMELPQYPADVTDRNVSGLAVDEKGTALFVLCDRGRLSRVDLRTGAETLLVNGHAGSFSRWMKGDPTVTHTFEYLMDAVYDASSRALIVCDAFGNRLMRVRGMC